MTHYIADGEVARKFRTKAAALRYLKRVRAPVASRNSHSGHDWSAPPAGVTGAVAAAPKGQSPTGARP